MKLVVFLLLGVALGFCAGNGVNGGGTCVGCTVLVGLVEQIAEYHNRTAVKALEMLCNYLPSGTFRLACDTLVEHYGPIAIKLIEERESPDVVCLALGLCTRESGETCHLFPLPSDYRRRVDAIATRLNLQRQSSLPTICNLPGIDEICAWIERFADQHDPLDDVDGDRFSPLDTFRGASWRGRDCDDVDSRVHPGRRTTDDALADTNCNGVYGRDSVTGRTYEELWCADAQSYGTLLLGDSVGAHFHLPPAWLNVTRLTKTAFDHVVFIAGNELDWPQFSSVTGHMNISWLDVIEGPVDSLYLRLLEQNRCNHRDYQNIGEYCRRKEVHCLRKRDCISLLLGVNGARASAMASQIVKSISRNPVDDYPLFITYEVVGNDVCNGHPGTEHMTTPEEFYAENKKAFEYLDAHIPKGSKMIVYGLVDGRVLYDNMHDRIYPIGALHNDVTYAQFYHYLNCLEISPCFGWMNVNETWRNKTTERAFELNKALKDLVDNITLTNIELLYFDDVLTRVIEYWKSQGGETWQLIEPSDGFHPNQLSNSLTAKIVWERLMKDYPHWIPPVNPHNQNITNRFGNQGGY